MATYRNLLTRMFEDRRANWRELAGTRVVADFGESEDERKRSFRAMAVIDLSPLPRLGVKGNDLSEWLSDSVYDIGSRPNLAGTQADGVLVARLSEGELLLLADPTATEHPAFAAIDGESQDCYAVRRQDSHYWFAVTGEGSPAMFAKLCGVELSSTAFANHAVAQTSVAGTSAIIIRHDIRKTPCFYLLGDCSGVRYMWECIEDAMQEFTGRVLGLRALWQCTSDAGYN